MGHHGALLLLLLTPAFAWLAPPSLARGRVLPPRAAPPDVSEVLVSSSERTQQRVVLPVVAVSVGASLGFTPFALALRSLLDVGQIDVIGHDQGQ